MPDYVYPGRIVRGGASKAILDAAGAGPESVRAVRVPNFPSSSRLPSAPTNWPWRAQSAGRMAATLAAARGSGHGLYAQFLCRRIAAPPDPMCLFLRGRERAGRGRGAGP